MPNPKTLHSEHIHFLDLGSETALFRAQKYIKKHPNRRVVAVDLKAFRHVPEGIETHSKDAIDYVSSLPSESVGIVNDEFLLNNLFKQILPEKLRTTRKHTRHSIETHLRNEKLVQYVQNVKRVLVSNGRFVLNLPQTFGKLVIPFLEENGFTVTSRLDLPDWVNEIKQKSAEKRNPLENEILQQRIGFQEVRSPLTIIAKKI